MSNPENSRNTKTPERLLYLGLAFIVILVIIALNSIRTNVVQFFTKTETVTATAIPTYTATLTSTLPPPSPIVLETVSSPNIEVKYNTSEMVCAEYGGVDYYITDFFINGGEKPYEFKVQNMASQILGPFPIQSEGEPIRLKLHGGESALVEIWSHGRKYTAWTGIISVPTDNPICIFIPTQSLTSTLTPTSYPPLGTTPRPTKERTVVVPPNLTNTSTIFTPTSVADPTKTPVIIPSNTPIIAPSITPVPPITAIPTPTSINPNPKECEDGIDNDGDNLIDYPNDPQCTRLGDPHEDK